MILHLTSSSTIQHYSFPMVSASLSLLGTHAHHPPWVSTMPYAEWKCFVPPQLFCSHIHHLLGLLF